MHENVFDCEASVSDAVLNRTLRSTDKPDTGTSDCPKGTDRRKDDGGDWQCVGVGESTVEVSNPRIDMSDIPDFVDASGSDPITTEPGLISTTILKRKVPCIFNINLSVPGDWADTDRVVRRPNEFIPGETIEERGFVNQIKWNMSRVFYKGGGHILVFNQPNLASSTRGGNYDLSIQKSFTGRHYLVAAAAGVIGKTPLGISLGNDGQVSYKQTGVSAGDLAHVSAHESGHHFLRKLYPGLNQHSKGDDLMKPNYEFGDYLRIGFSLEQQQALLALCN